MTYCIDRFEGIYAVCEDESGRMVNIERKRFPKNAKESDCFVITHEENIILDVEETKRRKEEIFDLQSKLFKK